MEPQAEPSSERIRDLRLVRRIATGALGEVFLAQREGAEPSPPLVVKRLKLRPGGGGALAEAFNAAAHLYAMLSDRSVVRLIESFWESGVPILVLEQVDGLSLQRMRAILKTHGEQLDDRVSLSIGLRVFEALSLAHGLMDPATGERTPLVHGGVDPSCVLAAWSGELKMGGFAIPDEVRRQAEGGGAGPGTHGYLAPEQLKGEPASARADVYAASLLLWELLARRKPIPRGTLAEIEVLRAMAEPSLFALDALRPDLPKRLREAVSRGLEANPERRTITAEQLASVMRDALGPDQGTLLAATMARVQANAERRPSSRPPASSFPRERRSRQSGFISRPDAAEVSGTAPPPARRGAVSTAPPPRSSSPSFSPPPASVASSVGRVGETTVPVSVPFVSRTLMPPPTLRTAERTSDGGTPPPRQQVPDVAALAPLPRFERAELPAPLAPPPSLRESSFEATARASNSPSAVPIPLSRAARTASDPPPDSRNRPTDPPKSFASAADADEPVRSTRPSGPPVRSTRPSGAPASGSPDSLRKFGVARGPRHVSWLLLAGIVIVASGAVVAGIFVAQKPAIPGAGRGVATRVHPAEIEALKKPVPAPEPLPLAAATEPPPSPPAPEASAKPEAPAAPAPAPVPVESLAPAAPRPATPAAPVVAAPVPASAAAPAPASGDATTGQVTPPPRAAGHRIFVDGRVAGEGTQPLRVRCGPRHIQIGSAGAPMVVDVPCGGEVSLSP